MFNSEPCKRFSTGVLYQWEQGKYVEKDQTRQKAVVADEN